MDLAVQVSNMDINTVYITPTDLIFKHIKKYVLPSSTQMGIYKACADFYTIKKTIWNIMDVLHPDGILFVECCLENISFIVDFCKSNKILYSHFVFIQQNDRFLSKNTKNITKNYLLLYRNERLLLNDTNIVACNDKSMSDSIISTIMSYGSANDIVLLVGNVPLLNISYIKDSCREIIGFGDDDLILSNAENEGLRIVELPLSFGS